MNLKLVGEFYRLIHNSKCNFYKFIFDSFVRRGGLHEKKKVYKSIIHGSFITTGIYILCKSR